MPGRRPSAVFPDQGAKLRYLIQERGDQRERSRTNPMRARDAAEGGHPRDICSPIVSDQAGLAAFLGVGPPEVSRWCWDRARFPARHLGELCRLYAIREHDFRRASRAAFVAACDRAPVGHPAASALSTLWRRLLGAAASHVVEILTVPDLGDAPDEVRAGRLRYATAHHPERAEPLPQVPQGAPFWIRLLSPQRPDAGLTWVGWHLVLLNHDVERDGFRALLPRATNDTGHWVDRMPAAGWLTLPRAAILRHEAPDLGAFGIVAVLTREPMPPGIIEALAGEDAHGLALEPTLDDLTAHLAPAMQAGRGGLAMARYRVVSSEASGADA